MRMDVDAVGAGAPEPMEVDAVGTGTPNPKSQMMNSASLKVLQAVNAIANKGLQTDRAEEALALINVAVAALMGEEVESKAAGDQPEANSSNPPPALPLPAVPPSAPAPPGVHAPGTPLPGEAAPATPMVAPSTPALSDSMAIMPFKGANSSSHPKEYAMYRRFCEKNSSCKEVVKAWELSSDARLAMFQKWLLANGDGFALEACLRMRRTQEERSHDAGKYVVWTSVLDHFGGDVQKASVLVQKRRRENKGTSTNRNTGEETFLLFAEEERSFTTTSIEDVCMDVGADPATAANLMARMTANAGASGASALPPPLPDNSAENDKDKDATKPREEADDNKKPQKKKPIKREKPVGSQLETIVPDQTDPAKFLQCWIAAAGEVAGHCTKIQAELEPLESQAQLATMIEDASNGITASRKKLAQLGPSATMDDIRPLLQDASKFVEAYKKHTKVAQGLINQHKKASAPARPKASAKASAKAAAK